ncbi:MAG: lipoprotein-releasing ABC transporter permease subunit [Candidatus Edwardsbacteria bacterium]
MRYEIFIALRHLKSRRGSGFVSVITLISVGGVFLGVAALLVVLSVMNGFQNELRNKILGINAHIIVLKYRNEGIENYQTIIPEIKKEREVLGAAPFIYSKAMISSGRNVDGLIVRGIDTELESEVTQIQKQIIAGDLDLTTKDGYPGIVLGVELAGKLQAHLAELVTLSSPFGYTATPLGHIPKMKKFRLTGIFDSGMYEYNATLGFISIPAAQDFFALGQTITGIQVKIDDIYQAPQIGKSIVKRLGYPFRTNDWIELNWNLFSALKLEKTTMFLILILIILVAAFSIICTLIMIVLEKTKEIGILKSMGATAKSIMLIFICEGLLMGLVGTILGCLAGYILCSVLAHYKFVTLPADVYFIDRLPVLMETSDFLSVALAALVITFLATIYPSWRAARLQPIEAISHE